VALPVTTTRVAEQVTRFHGVSIHWTGTQPDALAEAMRGSDVIFGGDGRGGYVVPEVGGAIDAIATFVRLLGLVARTHLQLSQINARIPVAYVERAAVRVPWAAKGTVMRAVVEAAGQAPLDTTDGIRVMLGRGAWVLVLPDQDEAAVHVWAEAAGCAEAQKLIDRWSAVVEDAGH
jgi:mannose-1-phosphate guanylyltransferase/phosphomannomutase